VTSGDSGEEIDPIPYLGPKDGITAAIVDQYNFRIRQEGWSDDIARNAITALLGMVGQLEHYVKELLEQADPPVADAFNDDEADELIRGIKGGAAD
jgi:hypothetical protein